MIDAVFEKSGSLDINVDPEFGGGLLPIRQFDLVDRGLLSLLFSIVLGSVLSLTSHQSGAAPFWIFFFGGIAVWATVEWEAWHEASKARDVVERLKSQTTSARPSAPVSLACRRWGRMPWKADWKYQSISPQ